MTEFNEKHIMSVASAVVEVLSKDFADIDIGVKSAALKTAAACLDNAISARGTAALYNNLLRR